MGHDTAPYLTTLRRAAAAGALGLAVVLAPALAEAQEEDRSRQDVAQELQDVQMQLEQVERQALEDSGLQQKRAELQQMVVEAIREEDPEAEGKMERMGELQDELHRAQEAGEPAQIQVLVSELQRIQTSLEEVQVRVMQDEEVMREAQEFREALIAAMREIDPQTDQLLERMEELQLELQRTGL